MGINTRMLRVQWAFTQRNFDVWIAIDTLAQVIAEETIPAELTSGGAPSRQEANARLLLAKMLVLQGAWLSAGHYLRAAV
jgi:hypothetical protein